VGDDQRRLAPAHCALEMQIQHRQLFAGIDAEEEDHVVLRVRAVLWLHHLGQGRQPVGSAATSPPSRWSMLLVPINWRIKRWSR
jgi:hypothetical protein